MSLKYLGRKGAVQTIGHMVFQVEAGDRALIEGFGVENDDISAIGLPVIHQRQQPTVILIAS